MRIIFLLEVNNQCHHIIHINKFLDIIISTQTEYNGKYHTRIYKYSELIQHKNKELHAKNMLLSIMSLTNTQIINRFTDIYNLNYNDVIKRMDDIENNFIIENPLSDYMDDLGKKPLFI